MDDVKKYYLYRALMKRFALPVIVFHMSQVGLSVEQIALIGSAGYGAQLLLEFPSGALADKIGYKKTLAIAGVLNTVGLALFLGNSFWWFFASAVLYWSGGAFRSGADSSLFYERLLYLGRESEHKKILGNIRTYAGFLAMIFAVLAGITYQIHWAAPFVVTAMMALTYSTLILTFGPIKHKPDGNVSLRKNMMDAISYIRSNSSLLALSIFQVVVFGLVLSVNELNGQLLESSGVVAVYVGFVYAARHLVMSASGQLSKALDGKLSAKWTFVGIAVLFAALFIGYGLFNSGLMTAIILVLVALPQTLLNVQYAHRLQLESATGLRASIGSANAMFTSLILSGSLFFIGFGAQYFELRTMIVAIAVVILVVGVWASGRIAAD